jgi:hypothetical protein
VAATNRITAQVLGWRNPPRAILFTRLIERHIALEFRPGKAEVDLSLNVDFE